jgi:hypothetical protein
MSGAAANNPCLSATRQFSYESSNNQGCEALGYHRFKGYFGCKRHAE